MLAKKTIVSAASGSIHVDVAEEIVILDQKSGNYFGLEGVGPRIWSLIQNPISVDELIKTILAEYEVDVERCENDIMALLEELVSEGLVEIRDNAAR